MNLKNLTLNERSQTQKLYIIGFHVYEMFQKYEWSLKTDQWLPRVESRNKMTANGHEGIF